MIGFNSMKALSQDEFQKKRRLPTFSCLAIRPCKYPWCRVKVLIHSNTSQSNLTRLAKWPFLSTKIWCATCLLLVEPLTPKMVNLHITFEQTNCFDLRCCVLSFFVVHDAFLETHWRGKTNAKDGIPLIQRLLLEKLMFQGGGQGLSAYPICSPRNVSTGLLHDSWANGRITNRKPWNLRRNTLVLLAFWDDVISHHHHLGTQVSNIMTYCISLVSMSCLKI